MGRLVQRLTSIRVAATVTVAALLVGLIIAIPARAQDAAKAPAKIVGAGALELELNSDLALALDGSAPLDPKKYTLFLDGHRIDGLDDPVLGNGRTLVFHLVRNTKNVAAWAHLLGSPVALTRSVVIGLGDKDSGAPSISGDEQATLIVLSQAWLIGGAAIVAMLILILWGARRGTFLKDSLLPQIAPAQQPYSLGRWQMAFWFTLIFIAFVFLCVVLRDYNGIVSAQALWLMGISGATGIASIAVDVAKDTPADKVNAALRALGLNSYDDIRRVREEIADREAQIKVGATNATQLQAEIVDRRRLLRVYEDKVKPFLSENWYRDLVTDINGQALHRLQVFFWTWALGAVFVYGVYRDLAMPQFDSTLLYLMGISAAGYIGFKYPEAQH